MTSNDVGPSRGMPYWLSSQKHMGVHRIIAEDGIESRFRAEVTYARTFFSRVVFEIGRYARKPLVRADRSTGDDPNSSRRHIADDRLSVVAEPVFNSGIHDLKTRRVPAVLHHQIPCSKVVVAVDVVSHSSMLS